MKIFRVGRHIYPSIFLWWCGVRAPLKACPNKAKPGSPRVVAPPTLGPGYNPGHRGCLLGKSSTKARDDVRQTRSRTRVKVSRSSIIYLFIYLIDSTTSLGCILFALRSSASQPAYRELSVSIYSPLANR